MTDWFCRDRACLALESDWLMFYLLLSWYWRLRIWRIEMSARKGLVIEPMFFGIT
jgi:hypothetical protein